MPIAPNSPNPSLRSFPLRPEARPFGWEQLDTQQQEAARRVVEFIQAAVDQAGNQRRSASGYGEVLNTSNFSRVLTISGERGTGKTSVLLSVRQMFAHEQTQGPAHTVRGLRSSVFWLETLDLEPLPHPTNLLAAILVRIINLAEDMAAMPGKGLPSMRDLGRAGPQALLELRKLISEVALSWDGNLQARQASLDLDAFAAETQRVEETRLRLNERLDHILGNLVKELNLAENAVFVLPVDDFDMNPTRCLDLLRLLRLASVPRLVTIILGDRRIAEQVLSLKLGGELLGLAGRAVTDELLPTPAKELSSMIRGVASDAIRKLLPPNHVVELRARSIRDSLRFSPPSQDGSKPWPSLEEGLKRIPFRFEEAPDAPTVALTKHRDQGVGNATLDPQLSGIEQSPSAAVQPSLFTFLAAKHPLMQRIPSASLLRNPTTLEDLPYQGLQFYRSPVRRIVDSYFTLRRLGQEIQGLSDSEGHDLITLQALQSGKVIDYWADVVMRRALDADTAITTGERARWNDALEKDYEDHWYLDTNPIQVVYRSSYESRVGVDTQWADKWAESKLVPRRLSLEVCTHVLKGRRLALKGEVGQELGHRSAAALEILHDLLQLSPDRNVFGPPLGIASEMWVQSLWTWSYNPDQQVALAWPTVQWQTFWHFDLFLSCWNHYRSWALAAEPSQQHERLLYGWIASSTTLLMGRGEQDNHRLVLPRLPFDGTESPQWEPLADLILDLTKELGKQKQQGNEQAQGSGWYKRARDWIIKLRLLLTPEMGTPLSLLVRIFQQSPKRPPAQPKGKKSSQRQALPAYIERHTEFLEFVGRNFADPVRRLRANNLGKVAAAIFSEYGEDWGERLPQYLEIMFLVQMGVREGKLIHPGDPPWSDPTSDLSWHKDEFYNSYSRTAQDLIASTAESTGLPRR